MPVRPIPARTIFAPAFLSMVTALGPLLLLAGCGDDGEESPEVSPWTHIARLSSGTLERAEELATLEVGDTVFKMARRESGDWLEVQLTRDDWTATDVPNEWATPMPLLKVGRAPDGESPIRLESADRSFVDWSTQWLLEDTSGGVPGTFRISKRTVFLKLEDGEVPPTDATLAFSAEHAHFEGDRWRVAGRRFSGEGMAVWPGSRLRHEISVAGASMLRVTTCVETAIAKVPSDPITFRIRLDGELLLEHEQRITLDGTYARHTLPLPTSVAAGVLSFEVDGPFAYTAFLSPTIGPAEFGAYGNRPWDDERANLVVFLADTFRADNMRAFGSQHHVTPNLDRFAAESLCFPQAWSVCTSTLSAHSSIFSGLYPRQTGLVDQSTMLPDAIETIAELLERHGYRTGAITDKGFVSQYAGMAQGFQWFDEYRADMDSTVQRAREFLEADDGRPVFLFVQSYRVHHPYVVAPDLRAQLADSLTIEGEYYDWMKQYERMNRTERGSEAGHRIVDALRNLYLGAVYDLDRGFGELRSFLDRGDFFENGMLMLTSDHGEAFGEHGDVLHSGIVYEEQVRIPLVVHGAGIDAGTVSHPVSLIDLAPTLAQFAGIPLDPRWVGTSVLSLDNDRPLFLFQCRRGGQISAAGIVESQRKVMGSETGLGDGEILRAFDLALDPIETTNVAEDDVAWPAELVRARSAEFKFALKPQFSAQASHVDGERLRDLQALGYIGED